MKSKRDLNLARLFRPVLLGVGLSVGLGATGKDQTFSDANWISLGAVPGANGSVSATVVDSSDNLYIGGTFTAVGAVLATNAAKWNGRSWEPLGSGLNGAVKALVLSSSSLYAGGEFTLARGRRVSYVAKW